MTRGWREVSCALGAVLVLACSGAQFTAPDGTFSVRAPGEMVQYNGIAKTSQGPVPWIQFRSRSHGMGYSVAYCELPAPPEDAQAFLEERCDAVCPLYGKSTRRVEPVTVSGHPGLDIWWNSDIGESLRCRMVAVGPRVYEVSVHAGGGPNLDDLGNETFVGSFLPLTE